MASLICQIVYDAKNLPHNFWEEVTRNPGRANTILFRLRELAQADSVTPSTASNAEFWVILLHDDRPFFILACTNGLQKPYPVFIYATASPLIGDTQFLDSCMLELAQAVHNVVGPERVFSVFAIEPVCRAFVKRWSNLTKIKQVEKPYYEARMGVCTLQTLQPKPLGPLDSHGKELVHELRRATPHDLNGASKLCYEFAAHSAPFTLTMEEAQAEASYLIKRNQLWVHTLKQGEVTEVASIVATAREADQGTAITKVVTAKPYEGRGCAKRLVWHVCHELLQTRKIHSVVLYAAHNNTVACGLYKKLGFLGLTDGELEDGGYGWIEIGFDRSRVSLGHW